MNCTHCRQLIESGPLAELPSADSAALQQHAGSCAECGRLLASAQHLEQVLADLPDPLLPEGLEASIMQRVFECAADQPLAPVPSADKARRPFASVVFGGVLAIGAECISLASGSMTLPGADGSWQPGTHALTTMPHGTLGALVLAIGLLLVLGGLAQSTDSSAASNQDG